MGTGSHNPNITVNVELAALPPSETAFSTVLLLVPQATNSLNGDRVLTFASYADAVDAMASVMRSIRVGESTAANEDLVEGGLLGEPVDEDDAVVLAGLGLDDDVLELTETVAAGEIEGEQGRTFAEGPAGVARRRARRRGHESLAGRRTPRFSLPRAARRAASCDTLQRPAQLAPEWQLKLHRQGRHTYF